MPKNIEKIPRIGLIGCGAIAESYYLPVLARNPATLESLILVDKDKIRAQKIASQFEIKNCIGDYREILNDIEGAILALPTALHYPVSLELLSQGVHVLCEKPLAESGEKAEEMVERSRKTGAALCVNYFQRLIPSFAKVKQLLNDGVLGELLSLEYTVGEKFAWPTISGFYFNASPSSRGVLRDRGAHVFDHICWWLGGKPDLIASFNDSFGGSDTVARINFSHKACAGEVHLNWLNELPSRFILKGREATVEGNVYDYRSVTLTTGAGRKKRLKLEAIDKLGIGSKIILNFLSVIRNKERPLVDGGDVLDSIRFIDECYQKAGRFPMPWYKALEG